MGKRVWTDIRLFVGGCDLTGVSNKVELQAEHEEKDATSYGSAGWKEVLGGLASSEWSAAGQWEAGDPGKVDDASWAELGGRTSWTAVPVGGAAVGDLAYLTYAMQSSYRLGGAVGDVAPWEAMGKGSWPVARGSVAHPPGTARSSTGTGTVQQIGAVATGRRLYAAAHVLSVSGSDTPTITLAVESDDAEAMSSATTRLTFAAATARGGQILRTDGTAITDTWWRPSWTVTGTGPSFLFLVALGIQ